MNADSRNSIAVVSADRWTRVCAYVIDLLPALFLGAVAMIPIVGAILAGLLLGPYWLLRDSFGASLGKMVMGLRIVSRDGAPSGPRQRILRNIPIAIGPGLLTIPLLGMLIAPPVALVALVVEAISLIAHEERLGDRLAGTVVARR